MACDEQSLNINKCIDLIAMKAQQRTPQHDTLPDRIKIAI
jgi:hypothetical protein